MFYIRIVYIWRIAINAASVYQKVYAIGYKLLCKVETVFTFRLVILNTHSSIYRSWQFPVSQQK